MRFGKLKSRKLILLSRDSRAENRADFRVAACTLFSRIPRIPPTILLISSYGLDYLNLAFFAMRSMFHDQLPPLPVPSDISRRARKFIGAWKKEKLYGRCWARVSLKLRRSLRRFKKPYQKYQTRGEREPAFAPYYRRDERKPN